MLTIGYLLLCMVDLALVVSFAVDRSAINEYDRSRCNSRDFGSPFHAFSKKKCSDGIGPWMMENI